MAASAVGAMRGSLDEGTLLVLFGVKELELKHRLGMTADAMRVNHTNLE